MARSRFIREVFEIIRLQLNTPHHKRLWDELPYSRKIRVFRVLLCDGVICSQELERLKRYVRLLAVIRSQ